MATLAHNLRQRVPEWAPANGISARGTGKLDFARGAQKGLPKTVHAGYDATHTAYHQYFASMGASNMRKQDHAADTPVGRSVMFWCMPMFESKLETLAGRCYPACG